VSYRERGRYLRRRELLTLVGSAAGWGLDVCLASRVSNFIQTPADQRAHPPRIMEGAMHDSQRYRDSAAECLLAAEEACQPYYRRLHLSMAASWLSLARQDEAIDDLFASWDTDKPIREPAIGRH